MAQKYISYRTFWIIIISILVIGFLYATYYFFFGIPKPIDVPQPMTEEEKLKMMEEFAKNVKPSPLSEKERIESMREFAKTVEPSPLTIEEREKMMEEFAKKTFNN